MSLSNSALPLPHTPPLVADNISWKMILFRAPILWSSGILAMILTSATLAPASIPLSVLVAVWMLALSIWTALSSWIFWKDLYQRILQPAFLKPALAASLQWSLDDVLQFMFNPQWTASIVGAFLLPMTLYTIPTTPEQRAQVLRAVGVLPPTSTSSGQNNARASLTDPGSWRYVLPEQMQRLLIIEPENSAALQLGDVAGAELTDDEEDSQCPYSISPVWTHMRESEPCDDKILEQNQAVATTNLLPIRSQSQLLEPHEILNGIVTDLLRSNFENALSALVSSQQQLGVVAATAVAVLTLQLRHSAVARGLVKHLVHISVTAGTASALVASLTALLAPYCLRSTTNLPDTQVASPPFSLKILLTPAIMALASGAAAMSTPRPTGRKLSILRTTLARIPWKGAAAVLVLAFFQRRHRRSLQQREQ